MNKPYPGKAHGSALGKPTMGMCERATSHPKRWFGVCAGRAIEPRNSFFADGDTVSFDGSQHGPDEGPIRRGPMSSARARKVCCSRIGRSRLERSRDPGAAARWAADGIAMDAIANGGKA